MDDQRIEAFERALWIGDADIYRQSVAYDCVMVVPEHPFLLSGKQAVALLETTPRWSDVDISELHITRVQEGLIVIGYQVAARRGEERFKAYCTSTYHRVGEQEWQVVQHQQTVPPVAI